MMNVMLTKLLGFFLLLTFVVSLTAAIYVPYCRNKYKPKKSKNNKDDDCGCGDKGGCSND
ncbi:MAG: hypothetical protein A3J53_00765 [Candidatus Harrisonbacteria bacterium RIFCSPHIGHO2_02_FULL_40_20]|nr:MAG: hypothetical protein A3J53_00765 [Candidatus Harrisonbacteria bacterium RIFCSPHIGHO2_02_FULL_40_20]